MTITIRKITDEQIELAKVESGKCTASAAVVACVDKCAKRGHQIEHLMSEIEKLREKLAHSDRVMARLSSSADEALCIVRQRDLLQ
jgi:hypothetical protein